MVGEMNSQAMARSERPRSGAATCLDAQTGKLIWTRDLPNSGKPVQWQGAGADLELELARLSTADPKIVILEPELQIGTLAAGVIGVSNIMLVIVRERTNEIGIRRAIGATPGSIMRQVMLEAVLLTSVAGYAGLFLGIGLMDLLAWAMASSGSEVDMFSNPGVDLPSAGRAFLILVFSGALAGIIPARRAVRLTPVQALRAE